MSKTLKKDHVEVEGVDIMIVRDVFRPYGVNYLPGIGDRISTAALCAKSFHELQLDCAIPTEKEAMVLFCLDANRRLRHIHVISIGILNTAPVHPREVFRVAIATAAESIIMIHNHPTGSLTFSNDDIKVAERITECGELLGIPLLDFLVINQHGDHRSLDNEQSSSRSI